MTAAVLYDIAARHQVYLEGLKTHELQKVEAFLKQIDRSVRAKLSQDITSFTRTRLETLLVSVQSDIRAISSGFTADILSTVNELSEYEAGFEVRSLQQTSLAIDWTLPSSQQIRAAVFANPLSITNPSGENLLEPFLKSISERSAARLSNEIRVGYYQGESLNQVLQRVRGTRAAGYRDGVIARVGTDANTLVRTALQHTASQARQAVWEENAEHMRGVIWISALDSRTSTQCRALDRQIFPIDEGPRPPIHMNCRSTTIAALKTDFPEGTRLAKNSQDERKWDFIPENTSYYEWLKQQPADYQISVIGPKRYKLLNSGGISAKRFTELQLDKKQRPRTLKEIEELDPVAFASAGI